MGNHWGAGRDKAPAGACAAAVRALAATGVAATAFFALGFPGTSAQPAAPASPAWSVSLPGLAGGFLTDGRAISYGETCLGIIEHYKLAAIVGSPTAGTNGNVNPFTLPGGYRVFWTGMKVLKHDGSRHHGVGIQPTVPVARTIKGVAQGRDEVLERALEVVSR